MGSQEKHIELRISHRGSPYVAVLGGRSPEYGFERIFNPFHRRCVRLLDGRQEQVHMLPNSSLTYEIEEVRDGKRVRWYAATLEGDATIYHISRYGEYPEMPPIELEEE
jgi:hypothetical protein